ncbi:MAG: hypothetical protein H7A23_06790 [Leptospiraceae bacterium]|nr:hypothetical protein [Leptospiraceae bacterium]MCP5494247.1 hypothetical protein [Leptospiraceae bacterium]
MIEDNNPYVDRKDLLLKIENRLKQNSVQLLDEPAHFEIPLNLSLESIKARLNEIAEWIRISEYKLEDQEGGIASSIKSFIYKLVIKASRPLWVSQERFNANLHTVVKSLIDYIELNQNRTKSD